MANIPESPGPEDFHRDQLSKYFGVPWPRLGAIPNSPYGINGVPVVFAQGHGEKVGIPVSHIPTEREAPQTQMDVKVRMHPSVLMALDAAALEDKDNRNIQVTKAINVYLYVRETVRQGGHNMYVTEEGMIPVE